MSCNDWKVLFILMSILRQAGANDRRELLRLWEPFVRRKTQKGDIMILRKLGYSLLFLVTLSPPAWATPVLELNGSIHGDLIDDPVQHAGFVDLTAGAARFIGLWPGVAPLTLIFDFFFLNTPETGIVTYNGSGGFAAGLIPKS